MNKDFHTDQTSMASAIAVLIVVFFMQILAGYPAVMWGLMCFVISGLITTTIEKNSSK
jgi:hypothetical protein